MGGFSFISVNYKLGESCICMLKERQRSREREIESEREEEKGKKERKYIEIYRHSETKRHTHVLLISVIYKLEESVLFIETDS